MASLLNEQYWQDLARKSSSTPTVEEWPAQQSAQQPNIIGQSPNASYVKEQMPGPLYAPGIPPEQRSTNARNVMPPISETEQIKRYGGIIGSQEYWQYKADHPVNFLPMQIATAIGLKMPSQQEWDKKQVADRAIYLGAAGVATGVNLLTSIPRETVKIPIRFAISNYDVWSRVARGEDVSIESLAKEQPVKLPWLGEIPTYWKSYDDAIKAGLGPWAATLMTTGVMAGDVAIMGSATEALVKGFQPRGQIIEGQAVKNTAPIKVAVEKDAQRMTHLVKKADSPSEYYTLPAQTAKQFEIGRAHV